MKNIDEIKKLLDAFYEGETTQAEEAVLRNYFLHEEISEELQSEKDVFLLMFSSDEKVVPERVGTRISSLIDDLDKAAKEKKQKFNFNKKKKRWMEIGGIAASICLLISVGLYVMNQGGGNHSKNHETINSVSDLNPDDQKKIMEAQKALQMVSSNFNKGMNGVESATEKL